MHPSLAAPSTTPATELWRPLAVHLLQHYTCCGTTPAAPPRHSTGCSATSAAVALHLLAVGALSYSCQAPRSRNHAATRRPPCARTRRQGLLHRCILRNAPQRRRGTVARAPQRLHQRQRGQVCGLAQLPRRACAGAPYTVCQVLHKARQCRGGAWQYCTTGQHHTVQQGAGQEGLFQCRISGTRHYLAKLVLYRRQRCTGRLQRGILRGAQSADSTEGQGASLHRRSPS
jgi:hypothetical protein